MWTNIFDLGEPAAAKIIRAVLIYAFLVLALRFAGKRELAQLNTLDFIVLLAVANAVQNGLIGTDNSVTGAVLGAAVLFVVNAALSYILYRHKTLRKAVEGTPTTLITDGQINMKGLCKEEMTKDELLTQIQGAGAEQFSDVHLAQLEPGGKFTIEQKTPGESTRQYDDLVRRLEALTRLVEQRTASPGSAG